MFSRLVTLIPIAALAAVVVAAPNALDTRDNNCNTSDQYCCNKNFTNPTEFNSGLGGLLGILGSVVADLGITCTPITGIGVGSGAVCNQQQACCSNVDVHGTANVICNPIGVNV